jgi:hypothetical protein
MAIKHPSWNPHPDCGNSGVEDLKAPRKMCRFGSIRADGSPQRLVPGTRELMETHGGRRYLRLMNYNARKRRGLERKHCSVPVPVVSGSLPS